MQLCTPRGGLKWLSDCSASEWRGVKVLLGDTRRFQKKPSMQREGAREDEACGSMNGLADAPQHRTKHDHSRTYTDSLPLPRADHHHGPPIIQGSGAKPGTVPTDLEQSTGIERFEILSRMQGEDPFSNKPLEVKHMGTLKNPIKVWSLVRRNYPPSLSMALGR